MKNKRNPQWLTLIDKVADTWNDNFRSERSNRKDQQVMIGCLDRLLAGKALSENQKKAFMQSIRLRVSGDYVDFQWEGHIMLTRHQRTHAKRNGVEDAIRAKTAAPNSPEKAELDQRSFSIKSAADKRNFSETSADCGANALLISASTALTERYDTKRNDTYCWASPIGTMASPSDVDGPSSHQQACDGSSSLATHALATPVISGGELRSLASREKVEVNAASEENAAPQILGCTIEEDLTLLQRRAMEAAIAAGQAQFEQQEVPTGPSIAELLGHVKPGLVSTKELHVSLWRSEDKMTGAIKVDGVTYQLMFRNWGLVEEQMTTAARDTLDGKWWNHHVYEVNDDLVEAHRAERSRNRETWVRFGISPLYRDRYCREVAMHRVVLRCAWDEHNQPLGIIITNGCEPEIEVMVKPFAGKAERSPTHKGSYRKKKA